MAKLAIITIFYYPSDSQIQMFSALSGSGYPIYVFDNTPCHALNKSIKSLFIHYYTEGSNVGISNSLNFLLKIIRQHEYTHFLFLDQDALVTSDTFEYTNRLINKFNMHKNNYAALSFRNHNYTRTRNTNIIISSGTIFNLDSLRTLGDFDESYFVDGVDYKFCLDALMFNYKIANIKPPPGYDHHSGQDSKIISPFFNNYNISLKRYNLRRNWGIVTSHLKLIYSAILYREIKFACKISILLFTTILKQIVSNLFYYFNSNRA